MARLDIPVMGDYDYFRQPEPWCCAGVGVNKRFEIPYDFDYQIDKFREQIVNHIQDIADENMVKSYQFCSIDGNITYDICGERTVRINFICKVSKSEVLKFKDYIYKYIGGLTECLYSRYYKLDFNLRVIETEPIQELAIIFKEENIMKQLPEIKKVIHSGDYTHTSFGKTIQRLLLREQMEHLMTRTVLLHRLLSRNSMVALKRLSLSMN